MFDENKINQFKKIAIDQGVGEDLVNSFIESKKIQQPTPADVTYTGLSDTPTPGFNTMGVEDEKQQMSRYMTPEEQGNIFGSQNSMLPGRYEVTQPFGNRSSIEKYSGGVNLGTDLAVPQNTPLSVPPGQWIVDKASPGWNGGSGNYVRVKNMQTGETIGFEHLSKIGVQPGQQIDGGTVIGLSGGGQSGPGRGNSTNSHASIPYQDAQGRYKDILSTPYAKWLYGS